MDEKKLREIVGGTQALGIMCVGLVNRVFDYLGEKGPATAEQIAEDLGLDAAYVKRWAEAAWAFDLIEESGGEYSVTENAARYLCSDSPDAQRRLVIWGIFQTLLCYEMLGYMKSGMQPGFQLLGRYPALAREYGRVLEQSMRQMLEADVLPRAKAIERVGTNGGRVLDVGCGTGWFLLILAEKFPALRGLGVDDHADNIAGLRESLAERGLADRILADTADIHAYDFGVGGYDLASLNFVMHHLKDGRDEVLARVARSLRPGGSVLVMDFAFPDRREDLRDPANRMLAFQAMMEHMFTGLLLTQSDIEKTLADAGLVKRETHALQGGVICMVVAEKVR